MKPSLLLNITGNFHFQANISDRLRGGATLRCVQSDKPELGDLIADDQGSRYVALASIQSGRPHVSAVDLLELSQSLTVSRPSTRGKAPVVAEGLQASISTSENKEVRIRLDHAAAVSTDLYRRANLRTQLGDLQRQFDPVDDLDLVQAAGDYIEAYDSATTIIIESGADIELGDIVRDQDGHAYTVKKVDRRSLRKLWVVTATKQPSKSTLTERIFRR